MKYKVSLLPEVRKKRIIGKEKIERFRSVVITAFVIIIALFAFVLTSKIFAENKLKTIIADNKNYEEKVASLSQYRDISANLESKVQLIDSIKVEEPYLHQFVVAVGNIDRPGISITSIECTDWKTTRQCTITGTCSTRSEYLSFKKAAEKLKYVQSVTDGDYQEGFGTEDGLSTFTVTLTAIGGQQPVDLSMEEAGFLEVSTTVVDENAGLDVE